MDISNLTQQQKVETLQALYRDVAGQGREGDTQLAHINPQEAALLKALGGSGTINPNTGLPEYKKAVKSVSKLAVKVAPYAMMGYSMYSMAQPGGFFAQQGFGSSVLGGPIANANASMMMNPAILNPGMAQPGILSSLGNVAKNIFSTQGVQSLGSITQVAGYLGQRKQAGVMQDTLKESARLEKEKIFAQKAYDAVESRRKRVAAARLQRINAGQMTAQLGNAGIGAGSSPYLGAQSSIQTQTNTNQGDIYAAEGASNYVNNVAQLSADQMSRYYTAQGNNSMWQNVQQLGGNITNSAKDIVSIFA